MKRLIPLIALMAWTFSAWAVNYPDTTTSVVLQYTGSTVNYGKFGSITNTQQIEVTPNDARQLIGDTRFAVIKINGVSSATWYTASPQNNVIGWPGWLCWDATNNNLYAKDTGEGTTTGWILVSSGGGGGAQTPWATDIDGAGFSLLNAKIASTRIEGAMTNAAAVEISTTVLATGAATMSYTNGGAYLLTLSADTTLTLGNATGTNRSMSLELYPDGTHVLNIPTDVVALTATNQPFGVGRTTLYFSRLGSTNYLEVSPAPSTGTGKPVNQTSPLLITPDIGNADTTLSRSAAGILAVEGVAVPTISSTDALSNKTLTAPTINNSTTVAPTVTFPVINYGYLGTNNTSFGFYLTGVTNSSGGTINQWEAVYVKSDGTIDKADANGSSTYPSWGLATGSITTGTTGTIITLGNVRNDSWTFTVGATVWLSTTAGALTTTQPATTGDKIQAIGKAITASQLLLRPSQDYGTAP